jgi:hypothetical protein
MHLVEAREHALTNIGILSSGGFPAPTPEALGVHLK